MAFRTAGRLDEAFAAANRAVNLKNDSYDSQYNRALILLDLGRYEEALPGFRRAVALNPSSADAHMNLSNTLLKLGRLEEAHESLSKANALRPGHADTLHNFGHIYQRLRRIPEATQAFRDALVVHPEHVHAHLALSECLLQSGSYAEGWREYEWRWATPTLASQRPAFSQPAWNGEDIGGKTILVYAEQGLGDTLMFARYLKHLNARGARIVLQVQPPLKSLFAVQNYAQVISYGEVPPAFDTHCPLLSLPFLLGIHADFSSSPYITAPPDLVAKWRDRLGPRMSKRCGVVWSSGTVTRGTGLYRSMPLHHLKPLLESGVELIGMQRDVRDSDRAALAAMPQLVNFGPDLHDLAETAALVANLDLVITVDTATPHLVGAMGMPVWLMLAYHYDWRWQMGPDCAATVWYPSAKLFHQPKLHDWGAVISQIADQLRS
jgi:hypothetical protein